MIANKGFLPRLEKKELDKFIEDETTDLDELFKSVLGFLESANVTKKTTQEIQDAIKEQKQEK